MLILPNDSLKIFIDVDGTIFNTNKRFYQIYLDTVKQLKLKPLSEENYYNHIKNKFKYIDSTKFNKYKKIFIKNLESEKNIKKDTIIPYFDYVIRTLKQANKYDIYIVSFRNYFKPLKNQLIENNIQIDDNKIIIRKISNLLKSPTLTEKANMIKDHLNELSIKNINKINEVNINNKMFIQYTKGYIIGDTEYEIEAGKQLNLQTIAVTWGLRSKKILRQYKPDYIVSDPITLLNCITNFLW